MARALRLEADLTLSVDTGQADDDLGRRLSGRLTGSGRTLTLSLTGLGDVPLGAPARAVADPVRDLARLLADDDVTLVVAADDRPVVSLGRVKQSFGERAVLRSPHIHVHDRRAALRMLRSRGDSGGPALTRLVPPLTPLPVAPTLTPPRRRRVTTTHDPLGGGTPRLVYYLVPPEEGGERQVLPLRRGTTRIGSSAEDDLRLSDLSPGHVEIRRNPATDEYEAVPVAGVVTTVGGAEVSAPVLLRTGAVVRAGGRAFTYVRDEYADHGRPYGGREGGEFARQRPQPPRPRYDG
ncbi:FHA domain-containing protein [Ornithinimicrobium cerasi]|uniref:FHA domain-containing protein n=1 Tax=Ornithinimicrobium cerasi TaxID=2248773 RepID=UPI000F00D4AF|nr:FHA domain-containing protein [Ornithinimicrobium cerasi]